MGLTHTVVIKIFLEKSRQLYGKKEFVFFFDCEMVLFFYFFYFFLNFILFYTLHNCISFAKHQNGFWSYWYTYDNSISQWCDLGPKELLYIL